MNIAALSGANLNPVDPIALTVAVKARKLQRAQAEQMVELIESAAALVEKSSVPGLGQRIDVEA